MDWSTVRLIWLRELRDQLRDRRTLFMIVVLPLVLYPLLGFSVAGIVQGLAQQRTMVGVVNPGALPQTVDEESERSGRALGSWLATTPLSPVGPADWLSASWTYFHLNSKGVGQGYPALLVQRDGKPTYNFAPAFVEPSDDSEPLGVRDLGSADDEETSASLEKISANPDHAGVWLDELAHRQTELSRSEFDVDVILVVQPDFAARLERGEHPAINVIARRRDSSRQLLRRVNSTLERWRNRLREVSLTRRGLPPSDDAPVQLIEPIQAQRAAKVATPAILDLMARLAPFLLVMWSLTGALYPAVDLCAGEKERGTMETLLISPAGRGEIVYGKFLAIWVFSAATALLNLVSIGITVWRFTAKLPSDLFHLDALAWCLLLLLPLSAFFSALCLAIGAYARSTKEGQYYLMPLFLVTLPLVLLSFVPIIELDALYSMVPVTGVALLLQVLITGKVTSQTWLWFLMVVVSMLVYAWLALRWAIHQFQREEVLFREAERLDVALWFRSLFRQKPPLPTFGQAVFCFVFILIVRWLVLGSSFLPISQSLVSANIVSLVAVLLPPLLLAFFLTSRPLDSLALRPASWQWLLMALGLAIFLLFPLGELVAFVLRELPAWGPRLSEHSPLASELSTLKQPSSGLSDLDRIALMLTSTFSLGVVVPVGEELAFRGFILSGMCRRFRPWTAVLLSSFLFALFHANVFQFIPAFVLGVMLALFTIRSGSVLPAIVFHSVFNSTLIVITFVGGILAPEAGVSPVARILAAGLASLIAFGILARLWIRGYRLAEADKPA
jgi:sodium transport system permease protein